MTDTTDTPLTPEREQEIRTLDLLELVSERAAPVISGHLAALLAEIDRLRARVAELETSTAPRLCACGHSRHAHTVPAPHSCFAFGQTCPCSTYQQLPPDEAWEQLAKNVAARKEGAAVELAGGQADLDAMRVQHPAPCRVPNSPDCTCPVGSTYQSRILPSRAATCTCGHSGADHHHAGTACWANLPRARHPRTGVVGPVATCACTSFTTTS
ncbi:hypothetical protein [Streptomyces sp. NPDC088115]|uniref:hypothetical protein n=1 Tax=Streptomyces sp. NPDC088115 TaxID=3365824 RepID=UPI0038170D16